MDNLVFEETINTDITTSEFVDKQWLYVNDNNNSSYTGQITVDSTSLSNCGNYINWSEAYLAIPLILQLECAYNSSTGGLGSASGIDNSVAADFAVGLKNGYWQIVHSLTVEFNNGNIVQQTPYLNIFSSFKNQTSWSLNDVKDWGAVCGFSMDSADSWGYNNLDPATNILNVINSSGTGLVNNRNSPYVQYSTIVGAWTTSATVPAGSSGQGITQPIVGGTQASDMARNKVRNYYNKGLLERQKWLNYENQLLSADATSSNKVALMSGSGVGITSGISGFSTIFESYTQRQNNGSVSSRAIIFQAIVRLKDICDFFHKAPLMKGATFRMYINTNQTYFTAAYVNQQVVGAVAGTIPASQAVANAYGNQLNTGAVYLTSSPVILGGGATNPIMLSSMDLGQGGSNLNGQVLTNALSAATPTILPVKVGLSIVKTQFQQFSYQYTAPITSTRLYAPAYTMSPLAEQRFLNLTPTKKIVYNDIFYYTFTGVPTGQFNFLVSNGLPNLRSVLVCPFLPKASNGVAPSFATAGITTDTIFSPFTTTGATPDPISLTNFQIQISGKNLFINNELYDYEQFTQQLVSSNQLNGSLTTSLSSGLIGLSEFEGLYRWYYGRADRVIPSEDGVARAVQVLGTNNSTQTVNFIVFCEFERDITIDLRNGARVQ
jgi:hypothetical protein